MINRAKRETLSSTLLMSAGSAFVADEDTQDAAALRPFYWLDDEPDIAQRQTETIEFVAPSSTTRPMDARPVLWLALGVCVCLALLFPAVIFSLSLSRQADNAPLASPAAIASADRPPAPVGDAASLVARGDTFLGAGDIVSARLYYEQAADAGDARAALFMGLTFDSGFLDRAGAHSLHGDVAQAAAWYRRARDLGAPEAVRLLASLGSN